jgi:N-methylhydantoinase A
VGVGRPFDKKEVHEAFEDEHETRYGYTMDEDTRVVALRAEAVVENDAPTTKGVENEASVENCDAVFEDGTKETAFYDGVPDGVLETPAVVEYGETTAVVPPGWEARVEGGDLYMSQEEKR